MSTVPCYPLSEEVRAKAGSLLGDESRVDVLLGEESANDGDIDVTDLPRPPDSVDTRLDHLLRTLEDRIAAIVDRVDETGASEYRRQACGEVASLLISIREIWHAFPELWTGHYASNP